VIPEDLVAAVRALVARPRVLVALDFDGVIAPIVARRDDARPLPGSMTAVRRLATHDGVEVALVSGRALDSLRAAAGVSAEDDLSLVGSHGAETALRPGLGRAGGSSSTTTITTQTRQLLDRVVAALEAIADDDTLEVETKPTGAVLHTRRAAADRAERATRQALEGPGSWPGVHVTKGKSVVELAVVETSKGVALQHLRQISAVDGTLYVGDDVTDESAFAELDDAATGDVSVKVGPGETRAAYRIETPEDARELLQLLVAERSQR
jgi:trehalose-phosphatase